MRFVVILARLVLALAENQRDRRIDGDVLGALRNEDAAERALVDRLDLHGRLVGLDLRENVARLDAVAFLLGPFGELADFHRRRQRRHQNLDRHVQLSSAHQALTRIC
jgi:hypothetical protein